MIVVQRPVLVLDNKTGSIGAVSQDVNTAPASSRHFGSTERGKVDFNGGTNGVNLGEGEVKSGASPFQASLSVPKRAGPSWWKVR